MRDMMEYKGYFGSVHYNDEDQIFYGKIEFIQSLVSYEGTDVISLKNAFKAAVQDYLNLCEQEGRAPETPFKGSFNVRISQELHRQAVLFSRTHDMTLNFLVAQAIQAYIMPQR